MKLLYKNLFWAVASLVVLALLFSLVQETAPKVSQLSLDQLVAKVNAGGVDKITVRGNVLEIELEGGGQAIAKKEPEAGLSETLKNYGVAPEALQKVALSVEDESGFRFWVGILIPTLLPIIAIAIIFWIIFRQARNGASQAFSFGRSNIRLFAPNKNKVSFKDVAGLKEAKEELLEIVEFLKNPQKFLDIGARIPRGVLLMGPPGTGKCITGDSLVLTNKGPVPISEIPKYFSVDDNKVVGARILSFNLETRKFEWQTPSHWFNLGEQHTIRIKTKLGTSIEGTPEHPIIVLSDETGQLEFRRLDQLKENDFIPTTYNHQAFGNYQKISNEEIAYLLGILTGDGGLTTRGRVTFTSADPELVFKFKEIVKKYWGREPLPKNKYDYLVYSLEVKRDLINFGLRETYSENKVVPEGVFLAPKPIIAAFLRGLFDTDGYCGKEEVELSSSSRDLIFSVHHLLLNLGIVNRFHERRKKYNNKLQYYISITGDFLASFNKEVGFALPRKQKILETLLLKTRNTNNNLIYYQGSRFKNIWATIRGAGFTANREFWHTPFIKNFYRHISGARAPSTTTLVKTLDFFTSIKPEINTHPDFQYLQTFAQAKFFFSPVVEITLGRASVFDFTIPSNHSFVANSLINHNTLLARAVAAESNVPFFHLSGSELVELFVGVGAARTRDAFSTAKKAAPAILFIDEIDAVGRMRGAGIGGGHDEREQTLNQILVEMDGFERDTALIVISATNRPDVLDEALLRPGRFDRRVVLDLPDIKDREEILKIHAKGKPLAQDIDWRKVAVRTPGFSGADLANLVNEAAILAARQNKKIVEQIHVYSSIEKVLLGPERKGRVITEKDRKITAYHEAGHALIAASLANADPVHKVSIVSRGIAGGYTINLPTEETRLRTRSQFLTDLTVMMGGYVAEQEVFGEMSTGASNDLKRASELSRKLVTQFGMSDKLGPMTFGKTQELIFLGREISTEKNYSESVATEIDREVKNFINRAYNVAKKVIANRRKVLDAIAGSLLEKEVLEQEEFNAIIRTFKLKPIAV